MRVISQGVYRSEIIEWFVCFLFFFIAKIALLSFLLKSVRYRENKIYYFEKHWN